MAPTKVMKWLPDHRRTETNKERRVGVEVELAKLKPDEILDILQLRFGGVLESLNAFEYVLRDTRLGDFRLELDAQMLKEHAASLESGKSSDTENRGKKSDTTKSEDQLVDLYTSLLGKSAAVMVPWEIVTDPIDMKDLPVLNPVFKELREAGGAGTRESIRYAFGVHLNPELPDLSASTILRYLKAYFILHEWLSQQENVDVMRKVTPYIDHFGKDYMVKVLQKDYTPDLDTLIDDYLEYNPTRNRSLDMLPLFLHLDEKRVRGVVEDERVKPRPTLHYRLPNCELDKPGWDIWNTWQNWLQVEELAFSPELDTFASSYRDELSKLTHALHSDWPETVEEKLESISD